MYHHNAVWPHNGLLQLEAVRKLFRGFANNLFIDEPFVSFML